MLRSRSFLWPREGLTILCITDTVTTPHCEASVIGALQCTLSSEDVCVYVCMQVVGAKHVLEEFRVGVTAVMLAAKQHIEQGNLKHKDLTGQEVSSQVCKIPNLLFM